MPENLLRYSNRLDISAWVKSKCDIVSYYSAGVPTGVVNRLTAHAWSSGDDGQWIYQNIPEVWRDEGATYVAAVWVHDEAMDGHDWCLYLRDSDGAGVYVTFDPNTGAVTAAAAQLFAGTGRTWSMPEAGTEALDDGWHKVWVRGVMAGGAPAGTTLQTFVIAPTPVPGGNSFFIGGLVVKSGSSIPEFVPTTSRVQDQPSYETFDFPYHKVGHAYQDNSARVTFGKNWTFAARPASKPQRIFTLSMSGMAYYLTNDGTPDVFTRPTLNAGRLEEFYRAHQLYEFFWYDHPYHGRLRVRFHSPLEIPKGLAGGSGVVQDFDVTLIEFPMSAGDVPTGYTQPGERRPAILLENGNTLALDGNG